MLYHINSSFNSYVTETNFRALLHRFIALNTRFTHSAKADFRALLYQFIDSEHAFHTRNGPSCSANNDQSVNQHTLDE